MPEKTIKICFCAQLPPPVHGQNLMSSLVLKSMEAIDGITVSKIPFQFSKTVASTGKFEGQKLSALQKTRKSLKDLIETNRPDVFYYVPAPPSLLPCLRDIAILRIIKRAKIPIIFHVHALGLGLFLQKSKSPISLYLNHLIKQETVWYISESLVEDAKALSPSRLHLIKNSLSNEPEREYILESRKKSFKKRLEEKLPFKFLFLSSLTKEKGLFIALESLETLCIKYPERFFEFHLGGDFKNEAACNQLMAQSIPNLKIVHHGFVNDHKKEELFLRSDAFLYPSTYPYEGSPLVLIEALAYACPILLSQWRGLPDLLPRNYPFDQNFTSRTTLSEVFSKLDKFNSFELLRDHFEIHHSKKVFKNRLFELIKISN